ncbi:cytochrome c-type biogenesis protein CcmH [Aeromonas veronii]|uniref:cytochrome c-type biogenesis protein CcmH n=1 Tax=Aeromonas veronii TaxID=654 RepID=UPI003C6FB145
MDKGQSDEQVITRMTERFGDFVRYDPPLQGQHCAAVGRSPAAVGAGAVDPVSPPHAHTGTNHPCSQGHP